ncbi:MAG: SDR family oxidoreductase [Planctomycetota bacterium]
MAKGQTVSQAVLVTGSSTGIGAATALELDRRGYAVYAGVRRTTDGDELKRQASPQLKPVMLDVTDAEAIAAVARQIDEERGAAGLYGLVNNAGVAISGPIELVPIEEFRRQMEVNVVGQVAVTQAMIPLLRRARGRVVNIGSANGAISPPFLGPYAASKHAMEAIGDSLRVELKPWGIEVSIVEAGPTATPIWDKSAAAADRLVGGVSEEKLNLYREGIEAFRTAIAKLVAQAVPVERVVSCVVHALAARRPRPRYLVDSHSQTAFLLLRFVPARQRDWLVRRGLGLP